MKYFAKLSACFVVLFSCCTFSHAGTLGTLTATLDQSKNGGYPTPADIVYISYKDPANASIGINNVAAYAGQINWKLTSGYTGLGSTFSTYCVDILNDITVGPTYGYNVVNNDQSSNNLNGLGGLSLSSDSDATARVTAIEKLWAADYKLIGNNNDNAAAFQIDIWQIIYGNSLTLSVGNGGAPDPTGSNPLTFGVWGGQTGWETTAQSWLNNLSTETATAGIIGLKKTVTGPGVPGQDQAITAGLQPLNTGPSSTPLPRPLMGSALLLGLVGVSLALGRARAQRVV